MKIITGIILAGIMISCGGKTVEKEDTTPNVPIIQNGMRIAYYVQDSLKLGYTYYREMDSTTKVKQTTFQSELERKQKSLQKYVMDSEEKAKSGQLSGFEIQSIQQEAQRREQALYQYQQIEGAKLETETAEILEVLSKRVEAAGAKYCKKHNIDLLLIHGAGGQLNYIKESMDVTDKFVAFLNEHNAEIEAGIPKAKTTKKK
jgi:Skp family chaperone for outer membrane proteins